MKDIDYKSLYTRLAEAMDSSAPSGWDHLELRAHVVDTVLEQEMLAVYSDGSQTDCEPPGVDSYTPLIELRSALYEAGKGAWWTSVAVLTAEGKFNAKFDYDNEPYLGFPVPDSTYAADAARFPRDSENTPEWLSKKLRQFNSRADA